LSVSSYVGCQGDESECPTPSSIQREGIFLLQIGVTPSSVSVPMVTDAQVSLPMVPDASLAEDSKGLQPLGLLHIPYHHIARNIPYHGLKEQMLTFPERRPREFNIVLATVKTFTADLVVQILESQRKVGWRFDWVRSAAFAMFGLIYVGAMQWILYVTLLTWLFPEAMIFANSPMAAKLVDRTGQLDMLGQILVDNLFFNVFIYFPAFYIVKSIVQGFPTGESVFSSTIGGINKYRKNFVADNMASLAVWTISDIFIFAAPMYLRMPLEHGVSFAWTMFMSATRGAAVEPDGEEKTKKSIDGEEKSQKSKPVNVM